MWTRWSRRAFLCVIPTLAGGAQRSVNVPSENRKFRDPATEFELTRLTDPDKSSCYLPRPPLRALSRGDSTLLYSSDRSGSHQGWRMDLRSGESRQVTEATTLHPSTLTFTANDRSIVYMDGSAIIVMQARPRTAYALEEGWEFGGQFAISDDGSYAALSERRAAVHRLRLVSLTRGTAATLLESSEPLSFLRFRPKRPSLLYGHSGGMALIGYEGRGERRLKLAEGVPIDAQWSADGKAAHYLSAPATPGRATQLREYLPDTGEDKAVGATTQFVTFSRNADSSVFAGISGSKGAPYLLLLLRAARRELTVAEHKASDAAHAAVIFSGDSQRLYYQTDRQGRAAIYTIALERFIEKTEVSAAITVRNPAPGGD